MNENKDFKVLECISLSGALAYYGKKVMENAAVADPQGVLNLMGEFLDENERRIFDAKTLDPFAMSFLVTGIRMGITVGVNKIVEKAWQLEHETSDSLDEAHAKDPAATKHTVIDEIRSADVDQLALLLGHGDCDHCVARQYCSDEQALLEGTRTCVEIVHDALLSDKGCINR